MATGGTASSSPMGKSSPPPIIFHFVCFTKFLTCLRPGEPETPQEHWASQAQTSSGRGADARMEE